MGNARFFEDVEFDGRDKDRDFVFEEEYVDIPIDVIGIDQASIPDIFQEAYPNQNNIRETSHSRRTNSTSSKTYAIKEIH